MPRKKFSLAGLNPAQREAVEQLEGAVLILAGAGTGKTRTVTARIAHMVSTGICPSRILALTFTNKAANEMRERVGGMVSKDHAKKITLCTFHSLCVRILRRSIDRLGYKNNFTIYMGSDQVGLVRKLIARKAGKDEKLDHGLALALILVLRKTLYSSIVLTIKRNSYGILYWRYEVNLVFPNSIMVL